MADILFQVPNILPGAAGLISVIGQEVITGTVTLTLDPSASLTESTYNSNGVVTPGSVDVAVAQVVGLENENVNVIATGTGDIRFLVDSDHLVATIDDTTFDMTFETLSRVLLTDADSLLVNNVIVPQFIVLNFHAQTAALQVDQSFFIADRAYQVVRIDEVHAVAEATAATLNIQVTKDVSTDAPGAGTDLLTNNGNAGFNGKATANTVQNGTLTATVASLQLAAGNRLSVDFSAAATELVGTTITVILKAI